MGNRPPRQRNSAALQGAGRRKLITIGETRIQIAIGQAAFNAIAATMPLSAIRQRVATAPLVAAQRARQATEAVARLPPVRSGHVAAPATGHGFRAPCALV